MKKKFQPTDEQLQFLLKDAEFVGEKLLKDVYYDYSDYRFLKNKIYLRNRNGNFELKVGDDEVEGTLKKSKKKKYKKIFQNG